MERDETVGVPERDVVRADCLPGVSSRQGMTQKAFLEKGAVVLCRKKDGGQCF